MRGHLREACGWLARSAPASGVSQEWIDDMFGKQPESEEDDEDLAWNRPERLIFSDLTAGGGDAATTLFTRIEIDDETGSVRE
ncbi:MAG: hypothetical protein F9K40_22685, partial [Kofleriaceae bacterium]